MIRYRFFVVAVFWLVSGMPLTASAADRPNILWISCEDISPSLGCYGDKYSTSPNIDPAVIEKPTARTSTKTTSPRESCA